MFTKKNDRAFPMDGKPGTFFDGTCNGGLTKREYFAAMIMQGMILKPEINTTDAALMSVEGADKLIQALNGMVDEGPF